MATYRNGSFYQKRARLEAKIITEALIKAKGNLTKAAITLGLPRPTLLLLMKQCGVDRPAALWARRHLPKSKPVTKLIKELKKKLTEEESEALLDLEGRIMRRLATQEIPE